MLQKGQIYIKYCLEADNSRVKQSVSGIKLKWLTGSEKIDLLSIHSASLYFLQDSTSTPLFCEPGRNVILPVIMHPE